MEYIDLIFNIAKGSEKMSDLEQRVKVLESKVKLLEETLETLKNMNLSEQMGSYIQTKSRSLKIIELVNSLDNESQIDFDKEREAINNVQTTKKAVDDQIRQALRNAGTFSDDFPDNPQYFNYEVESGFTTDPITKRIIKDSLLERFAGTGLRITAYNGFETNRVIIPSEINEQPVISIGEKAFINAPISEVIFPKSLKAILDSAFSGCKNLKKVDLPDTLRYMGSGCFSGSGLTELAFPNSLISIPSRCCAGCDNMETIGIGNQVNVIHYSAFSDCSKLHSVTLPESLSEIDSWAFEGTSVSTIIFPSGMKKVSHEAFGQSSFLKSSINVNCVFLGKDTTIDGSDFERFNYVSQIYCLPGSNAQKYAREHNIPMKPLSEFRMEDYQ